jgi:predicted nucleic acid-binding protein
MSDASDVIADNTTLSNFARSSYWSLLEQLFPQGIWTPGDVIEEIERGIPKYPDLKKILHSQSQWLRVIEMLRPREEGVKYEFLRRYRTIGRGADSSVLAIAKVRGYTVLTDDKAMVKVAQMERISVLKTSHLLQTALQRGLITPQQRNQIVNDMRVKARFRVW